MHANKRYAALIQLEDYMSFWLEWAAKHRAPDARIATEYKQYFAANFCERQATVVGVFDENWPII
jgi:hypothetical protein